MTPEREADDMPSDQTCPTCGGTRDEAQVIPHLQSTYVGPIKVCDNPFHSTGRVPATEPATGEDADYIDIVFDGFPSHEGPRFVEVENAQGKSIRFGEWIKRPDGYCVIRFRPTAEAQAEIARLRDKCDQLTRDVQTAFTNSERLRDRLAALREHAECWRLLVAMQDLPTQYAITKSHTRYGKWKLEDADSGSFRGEFFDTPEAAVRAAAASLGVKP